MTRVLVACALLLGSASPALAQATGTLTGVLTDEQTGAPLVSSSMANLFFTVNACVSTARECTSAMAGAAQAAPDANGRYVIQNLAPGSYLINVQATQPYITEIYPNIPCVFADCSLQQGTPVTVTAGGTTTVDVALSKGGTIAGTVTRTDTGAGIFRQIFVYNAQTSTRMFGSSYANASGAYSIPNLPAGSYYLRTASSSGDLPQFLDVVYPNVECGSSYQTCPFTLGSLVTVAAGGTTTANFSLRPAGTITGRVVAGDTGSPLPTAFDRGVSVAVYEGGKAIRFGSADASGNFTVSNVLPGRYYVRAAYFVATQQQEQSPYQPTYFGNVCEGCSGTPTHVEVTSGGTVTGTDIALVPQTATVGSISGAIVSSIQQAMAYSGQCARVAVYDAGGRFVKAGQFSGGGGMQGWPTGYTVAQLLPGTYYVRFENPGCSSFSVWGFWGGASPDQTFGSGPCVTVDCDVRRGTPIVVPPAGAVTGIDFAVNAGTGIGVTQDTELYDSRGVRVSTTRIYRPAHSFGFVGTTYYLGLPDGTYYARTPDGRLNGGVVCADCPATAGKPIVLKGTAEAAQFADVPRYALSGTVRDANTSAPLSTITVELFNSAGALVASDMTDALGRYEFANVSATGVTGVLAPGRYFLRTRFNERGYADRQYQNLPCAGCEPTAGTPVTITSADVSGVDLALPPGGRVTVQPLDSVGVPIGGQTVALFDAGGQKVARESATFSSTIAFQVPLGTYYARTEPVSGYVMTAHGSAAACARGACDPTIGIPLSVNGTGLLFFTMGVTTCTPGDISPSILASGVAGRPFRQVFRPSTPNTSVYVTSGRLPGGLTLDAETGVLSGTPTESGTFHVRVASVDATGCAFVREYTLHVAQCAFTLSPDSATVGASGGPVTVTASDVCGYSTIVSQASWITPDATTASAATPLTVTVGPNPRGESRIGTVTIGRRVFTVRQAGQGSSPPFGFLETPANGALVSGSIGVSGWVLDDVQVTRVRILRDAVTGEAPGTLVYIGDAVLVDGARPDVERVYPALPFSSRAGWGYLLLTNMLPDQGNGTFVLHAFADDAEGHSVLLGSKTITASNSTATGPFGAIDTPAQGETIAGTAYRNWGWALTRPDPRFIPTGGSTIHVMIDGVLAGTPVYNLFRPDIATLFPGLANSNGAVGYRDLDTTALGEGVHTIAWIAYDNTGEGAGIGSRYFTVRNSADAQPAGLFSGPQGGQRSASLVASGAARASRISPLERLRIDYPAAGAEGCAASYSAYLVANGEVRELPAGATMSASGAFTWQPGPAFSGRYEFAIVSTSCLGVRSRESLIVQVEQPR